MLQSEVSSASAASDGSSLCGHLFEVFERGSESLVRRMTRDGRRDKMRGSRHLGANRLAEIRGRGRDRETGGGMEIKYYKEGNRGGGLEQMNVFVRQGWDLVWLEQQRPDGRCCI